MPLHLLEWAVFNGSARVSAFKGHVLGLTRDLSQSTASQVQNITELFGLNPEALVLGAYRYQKC